MTLLDANGHPTSPAIAGSPLAHGVVMETPSLFVVVPVQDMCHSFFAFDLANLIGFTRAHVPEMPLHLEFCNSTLLVTQRSDLMKAALVAGATHMLWFDSDMRFPKYTLLHLLATMHEKGLDVLAANYTTRKKPYQPVAFRHIGNDERVYTTPESPDLEKCAGIGMGCMLVKLDKFRQIAPPWFQIGYHEASDGFDGEDMFFARLCRKADIDIWIDHRLSREIKHIGSYEFSTQHAEDYRALTSPPAVPETPPE